MKKWNMKIIDKEHCIDILVAKPSDGMELTLSSVLEWAISLGEKNDFRVYLEGRLIRDFAQRKVF